MTPTHPLAAGLLALAAAAPLAPAQAATVTYAATLSGAAEAPPNASLGTGTVRVVFDLDLLTMNVVANFAGLGGNTTAAHIHCCTASPGTGTVGVATTTPNFVGFPLGVTAGSMNSVYSLTAASTYNAAFVTAQGGVGNAMNALLAGIGSGSAYFNVHSTAVPTGEIRGFLARVPEPASWASVGLALAAVAAFSRRRAA